MRVPTKASCSAGRAIAEMAREAIDGAAARDNFNLFSSNYEGKSTNQAKWLTLNTSETVRVRTMQRHKIFECACEYEGDS